MRFHMFLSACLLAGAAVSQIPIPPHSSIYNGFSRGFTFTAQTTFTIIGLDLPLDAFQAGDTAAYLVRVNGTVSLWSRGNAGPIVANIQVAPNDVVDIVGNWSPAAPGNFTAHNSYGGSAPYATTIHGVPHTLSRSGWQWDIGDPTWVSTGTTGAFLAPTTGAMGRVVVNTAQTGLYSNFTANVTAGPTPLTVNFTDTTFTSDPGGVTSWAWDFNGDSVIDSTAQHPAFTYTTCGDFSVSLTTTDASHPPSTFTRTSYIQTDNVTPSFTFQQVAPGVVQFTDTSVPTPTSWAWDLNGDSITDSNLQNPVFVYPSPCTATTITLTVSRLCKGPFTRSDGLVLSPNTHTTLVTGGNGLSAVGSGNTFDIQVTHPQGITICAVSMCPYMATPVLGTPLGCTIWVTDAPGGFLANHANAAVWRQVATGTGTFQGGTFSAPVPVAMTLSNPIYLPAGTFAMAIHMTTGCGVAYTTLTATTTYPGPDFNIICGNGKGSPFAASANANRAWNGRIHYSTATSGGLAGYGFFGAGCAGSLGIPRVLNTTLPVVGGTLTTNLSNLQFGVAIMVIGLSNTLSGGVLPLPLDLGVLGAPGCNLRVSLDVTEAVIGVGTTANWNFAIPNLPTLIGFQIFNQAASLDVVNPFGFVMSDAYAWMIGL
jgi:PKD repeat protein